MIELPRGRSPELQLSNYPPVTAKQVLEFRMTCREKKKMGMIIVGLGSVVWIDRDGSYMDGVVHPAEAEFLDLTRKIHEFRDAGLKVGEKNA